MVLVTEAYGYNIYAFLCTYYMYSSWNLCVSNIFCQLDRKIKISERWVWNESRRIFSETWKSVRRLYPYKISYVDTNGFPERYIYQVSMCYLDYIMARAFLDVGRKANENLRARAERQLKIIDRLLISNQEFNMGAEV